MKIQQLFTRYLSASSLLRNNMLNIQPVTSEVLSKVHIAGKEFKPNAPITIEGSLVCPEEGFDFRSHTHIVTDNKGCFDLTTTRSVGGTYQGVDQMGLFSYMQKQGKKSYNRSVFTNGIQKLEYTFNVFDGHVENFDDSKPISSANCFRSIASNVTRIPVEDDIVKGTLFVPNKPGNKFPAVITIDGGIKGRRAPENRAALLASQGFVTLALAFYGDYEGLPQSYAESPIKLEYFEEAMKFLRRHPAVDNERIGALGTSKGGEICLAMMAHLLPQMKAVCTINGSIACVGTSTEYNGETIADMIGANIEKAQFLDQITVDAYECLDDPRDFPATVHPFENSTTDLLMVVGLDDRNWKSELMADIASQKMEAVGKTNYEIAKYPDMGHIMDVPHMPLGTYDFHPLIPKGMRMYYGGRNEKLNNEQQFQAWQKVFSFFNKSFGNKSGGAVAELLRHSTRNLLVRGSSPPPVTVARITSRC